MVRGSETEAEDGIDAYRTANGPATETEFEVLLGIRGAATASAASNTEILARITEIRNDPTGRFTLDWTKSSTRIAALAAHWIKPLPKPIVAAATKAGDDDLEVKPKRQPGASDVADAK